MNNQETNTPADPTNPETAAAQPPPQAKTVTIPVVSLVIAMDTVTRSLGLDPNAFGYSKEARLQALGVFVELSSHLGVNITVGSHKIEVDTDKVAP